MVAADKAREHIKELNRHGVGKHLIAEIAGCGHFTVLEIAKGKRKRVKRETEKRILNVTSEARAGGSDVPFGPTGKLLDELIEEGFTKIELAKRLGLKYPLQYGRQPNVKARTAMRVEKFYNRIMAA